MIPKMIRLALVLLAVLVMALEFPKIYKKTFEQRERRTQLVFSEILNDFVTLKYEYDTVHSCSLVSAIPVAEHTQSSRLNLGNGAVPPTAQALAC